ncbi:unnamed protein product [Rotaria socialis]|uniref:Uncharacterized protein n=1 Tax=Rotaria socialis TaxID=392032 RepID=A0A819VE73_9BILA|nr:unnamed protein product [Rotaria socialis]CAF3390610.1 unnamed protein product [Rotaria socialis]CAF4108036.1 unnamed protein product [Rotaria socialis]
MGNKSSKSTKKPNRFFCSCILSKSTSSSSLSSRDKYLPTFDRIVSNDKASHCSPPAEANPSNSIVIHDELDKNLLTSKNRRSLSLNNVILSLPDTSNDDQDRKPVHSKPPLPPGKSITTSKLPPTGRSFRGTFGNTKRTYYSQSIEHAKLSIEDLEKSLHGASSIDQWIDSLPILGTPSLNRNKPIRTVVSTDKKKIKRSVTIGDEYNENVLNGSYRQQDDEPSPAEIESNLSKNEYPNILTLTCNREFLTLAKTMRLNIYLKDFLSRLNNAKLKQTFKNHFSLSTVIYPFAGIDQILADDLNLFLLTPAESLLPNLSSNTHSVYKIQEQVRSKSYFAPVTNCKIEIDDEEYKKKSIELDRTHVVITIENKTTKEQDDATANKKMPVEQEASWLFTSNDSFQTGYLRIDQEKLARQFSPFIYHSSADNIYYLSSNLIQQWFNTLILVNQTCAIARRFLTGDGSHITCLIKQQANHAKSSSLENNLTFAALRLPPFMYLNDSSHINLEEERPNIIDAFSSTFLSDNKKASNDTIHIDYEQYSFAFLLHRWPKSLLDNYYAQSMRNSNRKWPSKYHLNIIIKKPILLIPMQHNHKWEINFDLIEQGLFELMNESTLCFYALCQQLFGQTLAMRTCVKHCFLNYCEKYGLPFSNNREQTTKIISELMSHFLKEIQLQLTEKFIPNYFNHEINLFENTDDYNQLFDFVNKCLNDRISIPTSLLTISNRPIIVEFLFHFIDQLYQTFHIKRSQFHLSDNVLIDLHKQLCEKLSNDTNNNSTLLQKFINYLLNNQQILEDIQTNLTYDFETNAELVHTCLNQVRKADSSLIFHYTWTIYVQYLHTYYNVLWNI